jgi:hypothetical protein
MEVINLNGKEYIENPVKESCIITVKNKDNEIFNFKVLLIPGIHSFNNALKISSFFSSFGYRLPNIYECVKILNESKSKYYHKYRNLSICVDLDYFITSDFFQLGEDGNEVYVANIKDGVDYLDWDKSKCKLTYASLEKYRLFLVKV